VFTAAVLDHTLNPRNVGPLQGATHEGGSGDPGGGPYVLLWFIVVGETIQEASYETYGCPAAVACASLSAQLLKGKTVSQALSITPRDLTLLLGGLPEGKEHCPVLAVKAIQSAFEGDTSV
jgi:NifU-like protein involved in Fe-S cluster formation